MLKVGYVQSSPIFGEKYKNFEEIERLLIGVKADLIVLPELFSTGYTFISKEESRSLAETKDGETASFIRELSIKSGAIIVAGFAEIENNEVYNSSLIVDGNKVVDTYRKIHLFNKENLWFAPGNRKPNVYFLRGFTLGVMICFDWMFPEVARVLSLNGAQIIAHPSNLVLPNCQSLIGMRCIENRVFIITANRTGREIRGCDDFDFTGCSQVTSFYRDATNSLVLSSAPRNNSHVAIVDIDLTMANNKSINPYNNLFTARRTEFFGDIIK